MAVLELISITKSFRQADNVLKVLDGVNIQINAGEVVALVGASGSGKTTLLQIAGLLASADAGSIILDGVNATNASDEKRTNLRCNSIGFVYQFHHLLPEFSALENVILPQLVAGHNYKQASDNARELLTELGLQHRLAHRPAQLSGGEQQRVSIARAFANNPKLILADEPTGNLDAVSADNVLQLLLTAAQKRDVAILVATHNTDLANKMNRKISLHMGRIYNA